MTDAPRLQMKTVCLGRVGRYRLWRSLSPDAEEPSIWHAEVHTCTLARGQPARADHARLVGPLALRRLLSSTHWAAPALCLSTPRLAGICVFLMSLVPIPGARTTTDSLGGSRIAVGRRGGQCSAFTQHSYSAQRWVPEIGTEWPPVAPASPNPRFAMPGVAVWQMDLSGSPLGAPLPRLHPIFPWAEGMPPCPGTSASHSDFAQCHGAGGNRALGWPESRRGAASSAGRRGKRSPRSPGPPPPGPCGRPRPSARGGAAAPARGASESAGPAARGDAALQLGTHGDRHHPPEAARRRRPLPAEGARGSAGGRRGGPAGGVAGRSGGSTSPLVELPAERLSLFNPPSPLFLIFGAFGWSLGCARASFCALFVGVGKGRVFGESCKAFVLLDPGLFCKPAEKVY